MWFAERFQVAAVKRYGRLDAACSEEILAGALQIVVQQYLCTVSGRHLPAICYGLHWPPYLLLGCSIHHGRCITSDSLC